MITITGAGDHDRPDWLITMTGIRKPLRDARIEYLNVALSCFEPMQLDSEQKAMMLFDPAFEGEHQIVMSAAQRALGEASHLLG